MALGANNKKAALGRGGAIAPIVLKIGGEMGRMDVDITRKELESRYAEAQLRLAREKDKLSPDVLKIDRYERDLAQLQAMHAELERRLELFREFGELMKNELALFDSLMANGQKLSRKEVCGKIKFGDRLWEDLFFEYVLQEKKAKTERRFPVLGEYVFSKP